MTSLSKSEGCNLSNLFDDFTVERYQFYKGFVFRQDTVSFLVNAIALIKAIFLFSEYDVKLT